MTGDRLCPRIVVGAGPLSCNHRSCPQCGALDQQIWAAKQEARLLPVPYFMVTFTLPTELRPLCRAHPAILYDLILREGSGPLHDVIATKTGGARAGSTSVLHSWGRQMQHPALRGSRQSVLKSLCPTFELSRAACPRWLQHLVGYFPFLSFP